MNDFFAFGKFFNTSFHRAAKLWRSGSYGTVKFAEGAEIHTTHHVKVRPPGYSFTAKICRRRRNTHYSPRQSAPA
jgi:hypothetical protein